MYVFVMYVAVSTAGQSFGMRAFVVCQSSRGPGRSLCIFPEWPWMWPWWQQLQKIGPTWASAEALLEMTTNAKRNYHGNTTSADVMSLVNTKRRRTLSNVLCSGRWCWCWWCYHLLLVVKADNSSKNVKNAKKLLSPISHPCLRSPSFYPFTFLVGSSSRSGGPFSSYLPPAWLIYGSVWRKIEPILLLVRKGKNERNCYAMAY